MRIFYLGSRVPRPFFEEVRRVLPEDQELGFYNPRKPLAPQLQEAEVIVENGSVLITRDVVDAAKKVRFIQRYGTGMDHMDVGYVLKRRILIANTPGQFSGVALAEHCILLMLALAKELRQWDHSILRRVTSVPCGDELHGKSLGLIGLGASGSQLARLAKAFGMRVTAMDTRTFDSKDLADMGVDFFGGPESLDTLLAESDYLSIHVPLIKRTRGLIGRHEFGLMKKSARIINVARGPILDQPALVDALKSGGIAGAGLDVVEDEPINPRHPLSRMKNVVLSPHVAGVTRETAGRRAGAVKENLDRYLAGKPLLYQITSAY